MPKIKDVTLSLMPVTSSGLPIPVPAGEPISGETLVRATVKATFAFAEDEIGETFHVEVKLRGKDGGASTDLYTFYFQWKFDLFGHAAVAYVPYKEITASSTQLNEPYQAHVQAKLLDEDVDQLVPKGITTSGQLIYEWQPDEDELTAYVTLRHIKFSQLSDQRECLPETLLVKTYN